MAENYPNAYYEQLAQMIINNPSISLKNGEVCFYQGKAKSYKVMTQIKETPKKKTSLLLTPWLVGIKRKTNIEVKQETTKEYYKGQLYITNMRLVFKCQVDAFDLMIPSITKISQYKDGIRVISGTSSYDVMTSDVKQVLHIIDLMNKAQTAPNEANSASTESSATKNSLSRNDNYAIAAFVHYCEFGGKPIAKKNDVYPSYFTYDFNINNPIKYHQKVVDEGYLEEASISNSLQKLKVEQLKQLLVANGLSDKGKKDALIQRIVDEVDTNSLNLDKVYVPSEKGWEHLKSYDYLFKIKKYGIKFEEYEAQQKKTQSSRSNDVIWQILNAKFNEYNMARDFGLARNELYNKALLLSEEEKQADALLNQHTRSCGCIVREKKENSIKKGDRWGLLEAIEFVEYELLSSGKRRAVWKFKCDCGTVKTMPVANVKFGGTRSCGCKAMAHITNLNKEDITGERYDRLKAIRPTDKRDVTGSIVWEFECECGNKIELSVGAFRSGRVHSCGCLYKETRTDCNSYRKDFVENTCLSSIVTAKKPNSRNTSGYTGVYLDKRSGKWQAYINFQKKRYNLGLFKDIHDAVKARKSAEERIHDPIVLQYWDNLTDSRKSKFTEYLRNNIFTSSQI